MTKDLSENKKRSRSLKGPHVRVRSERSRPAALIGRRSRGIVCRVEGWASGQQAHGRGRPAVVPKRSKAQIQIVPAGSARERWRSGCAQIVAGVGDVRGCYPVIGIEKGIFKRKRTGC